jgi:electron transfer flavoprotein beta subunit
MNSIVCVKRVLDPAIPPGKFVIDAEKNRVVPPQGIPQIMNPYDAHALELALRLKAANGGRVTALSLEASDSDEIVRQAIAMGADEGILLHDAVFEGLSSFGTASVLTKTIEKIGDYQLILCGREAVDWDEGLVGPLIADNLGLPLITLAMEAALTNGKLRVKRVTLDGYQVFDAALPAVVTVSNEVGKPRLPTGLGIISAARRKLTVWSAQDTGALLPAAGEGERQKRLSRLFTQEQGRACEFVTGNTVDEAAAKLIGALRETGIV